MKFADKGLNVFFPCKIFPIAHFLFKKASPHLILYLNPMNTTVKRL